MISKDEISKSPSSNGVVKHEPTDFSKVAFFGSWRMAVVVVSFLGISLHAIMRHMAGITMVCMVNSTSAAFSRRLMMNDTDFDDGNGSTPIRPEECGPSAAVIEEYRHGQFDWTTMQQGYIYAGLAWGQLVTTLPAGLFCDRYSLRKIALAGFLTGAVCTTLVPFVAPLGYVYMTILRIVLGFYAGAIWPCINALVAHWVPASEMNTMYAIVTSGNQVGLVLFMPFSTFLCQQRHLMGGWPLAYFSIGALTFAWCFAWWFLVADHPDQHKYISKLEVAYIMNGRKSRVTKATRQQFKHPYKQALFSPASLVCVLCLTSATWGITCLVYYLPTYFRDVMFFKLNINGEFTALPFLCQCISKLLVSRLADLIRRCGVNPNWIVRGFNTIGMFSLAGFMYGMTFLNCNHSNYVVLLICTALTLYASVSPGFLASNILIAPRHAGLLTAWSNFAATFSQLSLPYVVGALVVESNVSEWRLIFLMGSVFQIFSGVAFLICGSAEEQKWAKADYCQNVSNGASGKSVEYSSSSSSSPPSVKFSHADIKTANAKQIKDESSA